MDTKPATVYEPDFSVDDHVMSDFALLDLPLVEPASTLRSTQQSTVSAVENHDDEEPMSTNELDTVVGDSNDEEDQSCWLHRTILDEH